MEGVAEIRSLIGSSLAFLIAFILPFGCFIVIENGVEGSDRHDGWIRAAEAMLVLSIVGAMYALGIGLRVCKSKNKDHTT